MMSGRQLLRATMRVTGLGRVVRWAENRAARRWLSAHPGRKFSDYYAYRLERHLASRRPHPTLGRTVYKSGRREGSTVDSATFATYGRDYWSLYAAEIGTSSWRCVDYGCGTLRLGQHAIEMLDPGCYWGIDVSRKFIDEGVALLNPDLIAAKRPRFDVITEEVIAAIRGWRPNFIFSNAVLQHVPPDELPIYFGRVARMMVPGTKAAATFIARKRFEQVKAKSWGYPEAMLVEAALTADSRLRIGFKTVATGSASEKHRYRRIMTIERPAN